MRSRRWGISRWAETIDRWQGEPQPHLSRTDTSSRNVLILKLENLPETRSIRITVRPSGTEPKFKIYIEVLGRPFDLPAMGIGKGPDRKHSGTAGAGLHGLLLRHIGGWIFPNGDSLLFWQLPLDDKLKYFEIEERIAGLKRTVDVGERKQQLDNLLNFPRCKSGAESGRGHSAPVMGAGSWHTWILSNIHPDNRSGLMVKKTCTFSILKLNPRPVFSVLRPFWRLF